MQLQWISMACIVVYVTLWTDILVGLLRLRKCSPETYRPELKGGVSVVRELHVYPWRQCCCEFLSVMHRINKCMAWTNFMNKFIKQCHRKVILHTSALSLCYLFTVLLTRSLQGALLDIGISLFLLHWYWTLPVFQYSWQLAMWKRLDNPSIGHPWITRPTNLIEIC